MKFESGKVAKIASTKMNRLSYIALLQVNDNYSWLNGDFEECLCFFFCWVAKAGFEVKLKKVIEQGKRKW